MSLRKSITFRVVGYGLAVFTGVAHIAQRARSGGWHEYYLSAKQIRWTYGAAFIALYAATVVGLVAALLHIQKWWRGRTDPPGRKPEANRCVNESIEAQRIKRRCGARGFGLVPRTLATGSA